MGGPELISPQAQTVLHIERRRKLDRAIEGLAGYSKGVHIINNRKTLMQRGAQLIVPEAGDWSVIDAMLSSRLGYDAAESTNPLQQVWYFEGWLQRALENLYLAGGRGPERPGARPRRGAGQRQKPPPTLHYHPGPGGPLRRSAALPFRGHGFQR